MLVVPMLLWFTGVDVACYRSVQCGLPMTKVKLSPSSTILFAAYFCRLRGEARSVQLRLMCSRDESRKLAVAIEPACRTYPKNAKSHVICKVKKEEKCISPMPSVKCLGKKHMTWDLCNCLGPKEMQNMSCQLTHTLYMSHPTWTKIVYECMTTC